MVDLIFFSSLNFPLETTVIDYILMGYLIEESQHLPLLLRNNLIIRKNMFFLNFVASGLKPVHCG